MRPLSIDPVLSRFLKRNPLPRKKISPPNVHAVFHYFGYGSNMSLASLRAKGVEPVASEPAELRGWRLRFNVRHFFRHEGGVANIVPAGAGARVPGVLHLCDDDALGKLDAAEACGFGYSHARAEVRCGDRTVEALAYVGMPAFLDDRCLPSRRYLNILCSGAAASGLEEAYVETLRQHPVHAKQDYPLFLYPEEPDALFDQASLEASPHLTALAGAVFDMRRARPQHEYLKRFFGGRDMTLFHLKRMDTSDGSETEEDLTGNRISPEQRHYLDEYLHEYSSEYELAGRFLPHLSLIRNTNPLTSPIP
jgi:hypothetical protein